MSCCAVFVFYGGNIALARKGCKDCLDYMDCITVFLSFG